MRLLMFLSMAAAFAPPALAATRGAVVRQEAADIALVRAFFAAFDARDESAMRRLLAPSATLTHDNGVTTDVATMMRIIHDTAEWPPRTRELSRFNVVPLPGSVQVLTLLDKVRFTPSRSSADRK